MSLRDRGWSLSGELGPMLVKTYAVVSLLLGLGIAFAVSGYMTLFSATFYAALFQFVLALVAVAGVLVIVVGGRA